MTGFQHLAVDTADGPHVTLLAGVEMAGCYWATTSSSAAKVRMIRSNGRAAVLDAPGDPFDRAGWTLIAGRATILDTKRPCDWLVDPLAASLAGIAVARIGLSNIELHTLDILAFPPSLGSFDYIIAHGFCSWVPAFVLEKFFAVCQAHLTPHGVIFASYNTYPQAHARESTEAKGQRAM